MALAKKVNRTDNKALSPYYLGAQTATKKGGKLSSHYVMISPLVAPRLGIKGKATRKPTDKLLGGAIFDTNRTYSKGEGAGKGKTNAKRFIEQGSKPVDLYTGNYVKNAKGKDVKEFYTVGFPSSLTMVNIIFFVNKQMPLVKYMKHGGRTYVSRKIEIPKNEKIIAETAVAG